MDKDEINKERRNRKALERLGTDHPACVLCGENNPCCLEKHHVAGRVFDGLEVILCRNCHRKQSDVQKDHPKAQSNPPSQTETIGHLLLGLAEFFVELAAKLKEFGLYLINQTLNQKEG